MSADEETIAVYDTHSHSYARRHQDWIEPGYTDYIARLPAGGHIHDLGCGPGHMARRFLTAGFTVDATDATPAMVSRARELGVAARIARFEDLDATSVYDGVWASYALLHAARSAMPAHLVRIQRALKPGGWLHLGMKLGQGEARDTLGRLYTYYSQDELEQLLRNSGLTPVAHETSSGTGLDGSPYQGIWIHAHA